MTTKHLQLKKTLSNCDKKLKSMPVFYCFAFNSPKFAQIVNRIMQLCDSMIAALYTLDIHYQKVDIKCPNKSPQIADFFIQQVRVIYRLGEPLSSTLMFGGHLFLKRIYWIWK